MTLHYLLHHWQSEPGSVLAFGGEKRLNGAECRVGAHADPIINHVDDHLLWPGRLIAVRGFRKYVTGDNDTTAIRHGIDRIKYQVRKRLANFSFGTVNRR